VCTICCEKESADQNAPMSSNTEIPSDEIISFELTFLWLTYTGNYGFSAKNQPDPLPPGSSKSFKGEELVILDLDDHAGVNMYWVSSQ